MGKFKAEFQDYLQSSDAQRGTVIHSFAGAKFILDEYHHGAGTDEELAAELIAYAIAAHHGQFDLQYGQKENGFLHRQQAKGICFEESRDAFLQNCCTKVEINRLMDCATDEITQLLDKVYKLPIDADCDAGGREICFYLALTARLILSAVIDGDRTDTAAFMAGIPHNEDLEPPDWDTILNRVEKKLAEFTEDTPIKHARRRISDQCRAFAEKPGGIYRLNVPTGGGKTLSSLRYGLAHAARWNKSRIIFTAPLLTILEQNAAVLREYIGDDSLVLEHHSNVTISQDSEDSGERDALIDSWDAPVIITTLVQLLNTMFDGKTTSIRRFHSLADSIIVIDEVQSVPIKLLSLFNLAVNFLTYICGATVVLCSATQPCLTRIEHPLIGKQMEIVPYDPEIWKAFKRTELTDAGGCKLSEVPDFARNVLVTTNSLLIVCNKKAEAEEIYNELCSDGYDCFHLSAAMCTEHRRNTLKALQSSLEQCSTDSKTVCVSTQVIEAGVDISFGAVIRLTAGMDSIVQSAGRCNRNAESNTPAPVYILEVLDEDLKMLSEILNAKKATGQLLHAWHMHPERFAGTLDSDAAIERYYTTLYRDLDEGCTGFPVKGDTIFNLLSINQSHCNEACSFTLQQAFKTAGSLFEVFDDSSIDAIVPYGKGADLIVGLYSTRAQHDYGYRRQLIAEAKNYTVTVYRYQQEKLEKANGLHWLYDNSIAVLNLAHYDKNTGFTMNQANFDFEEA